MHCLHLFTTGNITRHSFAAWNAAFTINGKLEKNQN